MDLEVTKALLTFGLTTVAGGGLTAFYQWTVWTRQQRISRQTQIQTTRESLFAEVSRLLDRRLYRLRQMAWRANDPDSELRTFWWGEYRLVVTEWNDSINRLLAMLDIYMSPAIRSELDSEIGARFVKVGRNVTQLFMNRTPVSTQLSEELDKLALSVYNFNIAMLNHFEQKNPHLAIGTTRTVALPPPSASSPAALPGIR